LRNRQRSAAAGAAESDSGGVVGGAGLERHAAAAAGGDGLVCETKTNRIGDEIDIAVIGRTTEGIDAGPRVRLTCENINSTVCASTGYGDIAGTGGGDGSVVSESTINTVIQRTGATAGAGQRDVARAGSLQGGTSLNVNTIISAGAGGAALSSDADITADADIAIKVYAIIAGSRAAAGADDDQIA